MKKMVRKNEKLQTLLLFPVQGSDHIFVTPGYNAALCGNFEA
jgi:hypothetical protein